MPAPTNDNFSNATILDPDTLPGAVSGTTFDATKEGAETSFLQTDQSVWYSFTPDTTGWYEFWIEAADAVAHPAYGLMLALGDETTLAAWNPTACESDIRNPYTFIPTGAWCVSGFLNASQTYYIRIGSPKPSTINLQTVDFVLRWDSFTPPANNDFASPTSLGSLPISQTVSTLDATHESGEPLWNSTDPMQGVWYTFTPPSTGWYRIRFKETDFTPLGRNLTGLIGGVNYYAGLIYADFFDTSVDTIAEATTLGRLAQVIMQQESTVDSVAYVQLVGSQVYRIRVHTPYKYKQTSDGIRSSFNGNVASTKFEIEAINSPANDNFANATALSTTLPNSLTGLTTFDATEEAGEPEFSGAQITQSIWFKFTPTSTGVYRFTIPLGSLVYRGWSGASSGSIDMAVFAQSTLAGCTEANVMDQYQETLDARDQIFPSVAWIDENEHNAAVAVELTASTTYYIKIFSDFGTILNRSVCDFDLHWEQLAVSSNDNFANRTTISGSSGSQGYNTELATVEAGEPAHFWWWEDFESQQHSVWFEWTCPATGWYKFVAEPGDWIQRESIMAVYTGSAVNALTAVAKNEGGGPSGAGSPNHGSATVAFQATSGVVYKIAVANQPRSANAYGGSGALTWATMSAPTGDTTSTALTLPVATLTRVDNYGNTDNELPPSGITHLSGHDNWYYVDGRIGRSKWWKYVAVAAGTLHIEGYHYDTAFGYSDYGILVYKGADYASLTLAVNDPSTEPSTAAVLIGYDNNPAQTLAGFSGDDELNVPFVEGETVWVCLVSLYDGDQDSDTIIIPPENCPQLSLDLTANFTPQVNNNVRDFSWNQYAHNLGRSEWDNSLTEGEASQRKGSTLAATSEVGEPSNAGYGPTRTLWYIVELPKAGTYKIWVESDADCVLGMYEDDGLTAGWSGNFGPGTLIQADDDSGPGNWPEITHIQTGFGGDYFVVVDSKTETDFTLKFQKLPVGTPPANDDFEDAVVISSFPFSASGTTINATAQPEEREDQNIGEGPKDTVWYKYVAPSDQTIHVNADVLTALDDAEVYIDIWRGTVLETLERVIVPVNFSKGWFTWGQTAAQKAARTLTANLISGETYYFRVQTFSGGSEDFIIYIDTAGIYVNIQAITTLEEMHGTLIDDAEIYVNIQASGVEVFEQANTIDSAEIYVNIIAGGTEFPAKQYLDAATVYYNIDIDSHDCHTKFESSQLIGHIFDRFQHTANYRWHGTTAYRRFDVIAGDGLEEC